MCKCAYEVEWEVLVEKSLNTKKFMTLSFDIFLRHRDISEEENSVKLHEGIAFVSLKRFDFERSLSSYLLFKSSLTWYIIHDFYFERKYKKFQET